MIELTWGALGLIAGWLVTSVAYIVTTRNRLDALKSDIEGVRKEIRRMDNESEKKHSEHFIHANNPDIHQRSYDARLIDEKFAGVRSEIKSLGQTMGVKMDNLSDQIRALAEAFNGRRIP